METLSSWLCAVWTLAYKTMVVAPMSQLYLHGPVIAGMWGGALRSDICARITRVDAGFWENNTGECDALIERDTAGWIILAMTSLYLYLMARVAGNVVDSITYRASSLFALPCRTHRTEEDDKATAS